MITLKDFLTASSKYPDRFNHAEVNTDNAEKLLKAVNAFLQELGVDSPKVSSGFRPTAVNANIPGAAKKSLHTQCLAIDLVDTDGKLATLVKANPALLKKYNLWLENPDFTKSWVHLDLGIRNDRPSRIFIP